MQAPVALIPLRYSGKSLVVFEIRVQNVLTFYYIQ